MANEHITIGSNLYEKVKTPKYLGSLLTNQNSDHEEISFRFQDKNSNLDRDLNLGTLDL